MEVNDPSQPVKIRLMHYALVGGAIVAGVVIGLLLNILVALHGILTRLQSIQAIK